MATWGEFIKEIPVVNKKSEGMFVKVDHVLDLWEERNRLRTSVAAAALQAREVCACEVEEMAEALAAEGDPPEQLITLLTAVAQMLRDQSEAEDSDLEDDPDDEEVIPTADALDDAIPTAESTEESIGSDTDGEDAPMAEPVDNAEARDELAKELEREGFPAE